MVKREIGPKLFQREEGVAQWAEKSPLMFSYGVWEGEVSYFNRGGGGGGGKGRANTHTTHSGPFLHEQLSSASIIDLGALLSSHLDIYRP